MGVVLDCGRSTHAVLGVLLMNKQPKTSSGEVVSLHEWILSRYSTRDRDLIERVMEQHPALTLAKAIEVLEAFGGL
jgi:hypothetical protein